MTFTSPPGFEGLPLQTRKALLLIDLQTDFVDQKGKLFVPNTADFLPRLPSLISKFRTKGDVFFIRTEYEGPRSIYSDATGGYGLVLKSNVASQHTSVYAADGDEEQASTPPGEASHVVSGGRLNSDVEAFLTPPYNSQASWSQCCLPNSTGASLTDLLSSAIDRHVDMEVVKSHYSPFRDASFLMHLRTQLVTELYICGSLSNISIYSTVIDAVSHGMSVTIIEDCVGYRDERCHHEAMRQMADTMGASGIDYQELMDDLVGLLGDVVREEDYTRTLQVAFQRQLQSKDQPDPVQKASSWLSTLEPPAPSDPEPTSTFDDTQLQSNHALTESSRSRRQNTEPLSDLGQQRQLTPDSPPRKRQSDDLDPDVRKLKIAQTRRRASHEGHTAESLRVKPSRPRRQTPQGKEFRPSLAPQSEPRPVLESLSTGDIPSVTTFASVSKVRALAPKVNIAPDLRSELSTSLVGVTPSSRQEISQDDKPSRKSTRLKRSTLADTFGPGDTIASDSLLLCNVLPEEISEMIFDKINGEVLWQKMHHRSGEVPRLVAVQGECSSDKSPIYRHPADSQPSLLPFTPYVRIVRKAAEELVGHSLNHVLIQLYRTPEDNISEHSDKTLDIRKGSKIVNYSAGAMRTMILRSKRSAYQSTLDVDVDAACTSPPDLMSPGPPRPAISVPMPHNSLFVLGPQTNQSHLHAIRADRRPSNLRSEDEKAYDGARISLTFRSIATFIDPQTNEIWGQGATRKSRKQAVRILQDSAAEKDYENMIRAFGQENHQSSAWSWEEWYGSGFDVVNGPAVTQRERSKPNLPPNEAGVESKGSSE